jgi:hypothetical protein
MLVGGRLAVTVWLLDFQQPMQSAPFTPEVVSSNPRGDNSDVYHAAYILSEIVIF